jgi:hypothetical protein
MEKRGKKKVSKEVIMKKMMPNLRAMNESNVQQSQNFFFYYCAYFWHMKLASYLPSFRNGERNFPSLYAVVDSINSDIIEGKEGKLNLIIC